MKRVASAPFTVSQLIEGPQGEQGSPGATGAVGPWVLMTKWAEDLDSATSITYWAGTESNAPYKNLTYYNGLWYACKSKYTRTASSNNTNPASLTSRWTVMQNFRFIASEVILAERGSIDLLQTMSIRVVKDNKVALKLDTDGLEQYLYDGAGNMVNFMRFGDGVVGFYDASGNAIWEIDASGNTKFYTRTTATNKYASLPLYRMTSSTVTSLDTACTWVQGQGNKNLAATATYYQLTEKASNVTAYNLGYTGTRSTAPTSGEAPSTLTRIPDGYYCTPGYPAQSVALVETALYCRMVYHFVGGYCVEKRKYEWSVT